MAQEDTISADPVHKLAVLVIQMDGWISRRGRGEKCRGDEINVMLEACIDQNRKVCKMVTLTEEANKGLKPIGMYSYAHEGLIISVRMHVLPSGCSSLTFFFQVAYRPSLTGSS